MHDEFNTGLSIFDIWVSGYVVYVCMYVCVYVCILMMMVVKMAFSFQAETRSALNAMSARRWSIPCGTVAWGWIDSAHPVCCATYPRPPPRMYVWPTGSISLGFATIAAWITLESRCVCIFVYRHFNFIFISYSNRGINFHVYNVYTMLLYSIPTILCIYGMYCMYVWMYLLCFT